MLEEHISNIDGVALAETIKGGLPADVLAALRGLQASHQLVDGGAVERALNTANKRNGEVASEGFITPIQRHGAGRDACGLVDGFFPTTTAMALSGDTLAAVSSPTVMVASLLRGVLAAESITGTLSRLQHRPAEQAARHARCRARHRARWRHRQPGRSRWRHGCTYIHTQ